MIIKELVKVYVSKNGLRSPALNGFSAQLPDKSLYLYWVKAAAENPHC